MSMRLWHTRFREKQVPIFRMQAKKNAPRLRGFGFVHLGQVHFLIGAAFPNSGYKIVFETQVME